MRKKIVAGNWKMNNDREEAFKLTSEVTHMVEDEVKGNTEVVIIPPFVHISSTRKLVEGIAHLHLGAQNCHEEKGGAYTGEISAGMLQSVGCKYVIVGHSERREFFGEDHEVLSKKVDAVLASDMIPIFCCGEKLDSREDGTQNEVVAQQVEKSLFHLSETQIPAVVIAYEPVWAIGTGKTASAEQAQEMHAFIRKLIAEKYNQDTADKVSILYGGSVKPGNAGELFAQEDIDGGLIGGASLKSRDFTDIIKAI
ncbi:triose-phosphate isomerase [Roseivirga sp. BDSF3-8]|uniref:triose-phosphate isomerase n=1 Tax=Roseivirga sp. BDSF3-8 TaxID=3241598 RepID=UPI003531DFF2